MDSVTSADGLQELIRRAKKASDKKYWKDAAHWYGKAVELAPGDTAILGSFGFWLSRACQYDEAIEAFRTLTEREPRVARWPYMVGYQFYMQEKWHQAIDWYEKSLARKSDYLPVLYRKAYAHLAIGEETLAIDLLQRCINVWRSLRKEPQHIRKKFYSDACFQLGKLYASKGQTHKAEDYLRESVRTDPRDENKRYQLGKCQLANGRPKEGLNTLQRAKPEVLGREYVKDRIALALIELERVEEAEAIYLAIPRNRRRPYMSRNLGKLYIKQSRYREAIDALARTLAQDYDNHHTHYFLGVAYQELELVEAARQSYAEAVRLRRVSFDRSYPEAEERLRNLARETGSTAQSVGPDGRATGIVESYNRQRGFGFIRSDQGRRVFFHVSVVSSGEGVIEPGYPVEFRLELGPKGPKAIHVRVIPIPSQRG